MRLKESNMKAISHFTAFQQVPISWYPVEKKPFTTNTKPK